MKKLLVFFVFAFLTACSLEKESESCYLLMVAFDESSELAPTWYSEAGKALEQCGYKKATILGDLKACMADRRSDTNIDCSKEEKAVDNFFK